MKLSRSQPIPVLTIVSESWRAPERLTTPAGGGGEERVRGGKEGETGLLLAGTVTADSPGSVERNQIVQIYFFQSHPPFCHFCK